MWRLLLIMLFRKIKKDPLRETNLYFEFLIKIVHKIYEGILYIHIYIYVVSTKRQLYLFDA